MNGISNSAARMKRAGGQQFGGEFRGLLERPAPTKKGASEKLANPLKSVVELRGIEPLTLRLPA